MFPRYNGLSPGMGYIPEMEQAIGQLERGTLVTKFSWRKKAEKKTLSIRRETREIVWCRTVTGSKPSYEGSVHLREIKEVRLGKNSKDFEKWPDDAKKLDDIQCFVIFYGQEFKLRVLSFAAFSERECEIWREGLRYLVKDTITSPYPIRVQGWLRREFYEMENSRESISLKEIKAFLPRLNVKIAINKLREAFNEVDTRKRNEIGFDDFTVFYQKLIFNLNEINDVFDRFDNYSENKLQVTLQEFQHFLLQEQKDDLSNNDRNCSTFICDFLNVR
nr:1-phosphatidylinositol 4,5-bisphosphate phosphodiesterase gamma-1-like [Onthophagus taurus]